MRVKTFKTEKHIFHYVIVKGDVLVTCYGEPYNGTYEALKEYSNSLREFTEHVAYVELEELGKKLNENRGKENCTCKRCVLK